MMISVYSLGLNKYVLLFHPAGRALLTGLKTVLQWLSMRKLSQFGQKF